MRKYRELALLLLSLCLSLCLLNCLPTVDPGIFVLQGVPTCREGKGYCLLGRSCSVDRDFVSDEQGGHCKGVSQTFTSSSVLAFVCCKYVNDSDDLEEYATTLSSVTISDEKFQILDKNPIPIIDINNMTIPENTSGLIEIIGVVTDTTGILDLVTRPYQPSTTANTSVDLSTAATPPFMSPEITTILGNEPVDSVTPATSFPTFTDDTNKIGETEEHFSSELQILNLPNEIRKYLSQKERESSSEKAVQTTYFAKNINDERGSTTPYPTTSYESETTEDIFETLELDQKLIEDFIIKSTTYSTNEMFRTERPSHLKGSPLVPFKKVDDFSSSDFGIYSTTNEPEAITEWAPSTVTDLFQLDESTNMKSSLLQRTEEQVVGKDEASHGNTIEEVILPHPINLNICGLRRSNLKVSDHIQPASTYDWCWSAALMSKQRGQDKFECSGTLVELDLVITTAACLKRLRAKELESYRVVLGDSNLRDGLPYGVQYHDIAEIVTHPDFMTYGGAHMNDIGLIRLRSKATIDHNVCLACVSQTNAQISNDSCVVSGYMAGNIPTDIRRDIEGFFLVEGVLRESPVTIEKTSKCQSSIQRMVPTPLLATNTEGFLCAVKDKSRRSCASTLDGGSPLVCKAGGRWFLTGISSWSGDCTSEPHIYTRVNSFSEWFINTRLRMSGFVLAQLTPFQRHHPLSSFF